METSGDSQSAISSGNLYKNSDQLKQPFCPSTNIAGGPVCSRLKLYFSKAVLPFSPYTLIAFLATRCIECSSPFLAPPLPAHILSPCPSIHFLSEARCCSAGLANISYIQSPVSYSTFAIVLDQT